MSALVRHSKVMGSVRDSVGGSPTQETCSQHSVLLDFDAKQVPGSQRVLRGAVPGRDGLSQQGYGLAPVGFAFLG